MYGAQRSRRLHRWLALVGLDLVVETKLLQHPQDALRARVVQVMDGDHGYSVPGRQLPWKPAGTRLLRWASATGPLAMSVASNTARSLRPSAERKIVDRTQPSPSAALSWRATKTGSPNRSSSPACQVALVPDLRS